jgi:hypothetical protein
MVPTPTLPPVWNTTEFPRVVLPTVRCECGSVQRASGASSKLRSAHRECAVFGTSTAQDRVVSADAGG